MPAHNRHALAARFPGLSDPQLNTNPDPSADKAENAESGQPDTAPPFAAEMFRRCSADRWGHDAWASWFAWSRAVSNLKGGNWFECERDVDPRYTVSWSGSDSLIGTIPGAFLRDEAQTILEEFGLDDLLANFDVFWQTIFACLQYPRLTPAALKRDHEVYGHFQLDERLEEAKVLLRERRLIR